MISCGQFEAFYNTCNLDALWCESMPVWSQLLPWIFWPRFRLYTWTLGLKVSLVCMDPIKVFLKVSVGSPSGIKSRDDVLKMGIGNYNEECRKIVMRFAESMSPCQGRCKTCLCSCSVSFPGVLLDLN